MYPRLSDTANDDHSIFFTIPGKHSIRGGTQELPKVCRKSENLSPSFQVTIIITINRGREYEELFLASKPFHPFFCYFMLHTYVQLIFHLKEIRQ